MKQLIHQGIKDSILYDLAPILAKHFGHLLDSEQAYEIAKHLVNQIDSEITNLAEAK